MRLAMLLGSGASVGAGMPNVAGITSQVLSGDNVIRVGGDFHLVTDQLFAASTEPLDPILDFVGDIETLCDEYFESQDKTRVTNYEDIAYVARQIDDGIMSEYENPALLPLNQLLRPKHGVGLMDLQRIAAASADYIQDTVRDMLRREPGRLGYLEPIINAFEDEDIDQLDLATLNHDLVLERALVDANVRFSSGFELSYGSLMVWNDEYAVPTRRVFKLHGSIDWFRYDIRIDGWEGQATARATVDADHAIGPAGEPLDYPVGGRPELLTGTFNKILSYPTRIYAQQHFRFHEALDAADRLLVVGYGFRDKAINARIVAWAERPGDHRMVVAHGNAATLHSRARGAIRNSWDRWRDRGLLDVVPRHLGGGLGWPELRAKLHA